MFLVSDCNSGKSKKSVFGVNLDEMLNGRLSFMVIFVIWQDFFNTRPLEAGKKVK